MLREASTENAAWLRPALADYEQQMLKRGFGAVSASRRYLTLAISRNPALRQVALGSSACAGPPRRCGGPCSPADGTSAGRVSPAVRSGQVVRR